MNNPGILSEMSDIVINALNEQKWHVREGSRFADELEEVQSPERREWLRDYVVQHTFFLVRRHH